MFESVHNLGCTFDENSVGMFVWAKLPQRRKSTEFVDELLNKRHLFLTHGTIFGSTGEGYVRFLLFLEEKNIQEAIDRIKSQSGYGNSMVKVEIAV